MALKPPEEKSALQRYLPIADWLPTYDWGGMVRFDLVAALTVWLAIFTGVFFIGLGLARMGWIANFMSTSVLGGFRVAWPS